MSIIIRLQNLPWEANSLDIRRFFQGLSIPDGGVHIVGGEKGDAFIAFASDEDARQAMGRDGGVIKDARVKLLLSSRSEMQKVIEQARNQTLGLKSSEPSPVAPPATAPAAAASGLLPTPLQTTNLVPPVTEPEVRHRSPNRGGRRRSRSMERERFRNRSRSRSPNYRNNQQLTRGHIPVDDIRSRLESELMSSSINTNNNIGDTVTNNYSNNNLPAVRLRQLAAFAEPSSHIPFENSCIPPPQGLNERRLPNHAIKENERIVPTNAPPFINQIPPAASSHTGFNISNVPPPLRTYSIEMRGLPFNVIPRDIQDFFRTAGVFLPEENVKILVDANGYTTGGAIVRLSSERDFESALSLNGRYMSDRRIDVMPLIENIPREQTDILLQQPAPPNPPQAVGRPLLPEPIPKRDYVVYMKGIPYNSCTDRDIAAFYGPLRIIEIVLETEPSGKPSGNAFVEFATREDFNAALELNMKHMGRRYIEVFPTTKEDMNEAKRITTGIFADRNHANAPVIRHTYCLNITGLPPTVTNKDLTNYFLEVGAQPYAIHIMLKPNGLNAGEAFVEFVNPDHHMRALRRDGESIGGHRISVKNVSYEFMRSIVQPNINPAPMPLPNQEPPRLAGPLLNMPDIRAREKPMRNSHGADDYRRNKEDRGDRRMRGDPFADPRCVVHASNIPYRATDEDICVFFADFNITQNCVLRRYNDKGQPTADAKIAFRTPEDANRAVRQMHKKFLIERPVFLRHAV
ncbi:RNA-binding-like protein 2 [Dinothrombium tinctorium]|uniref:RNA-binding-like protein 2 n=1 Tax=Dinothrombium tinctorium TaxID=1965070 RepID=A0A3S4R6V6_9ACAR|nr:RNA-binding-like protein 2 [Dinothrombium tinctorium]